MDTRFHCVYLLTSLDPQCEGDYYIGYTVNPLRRLRQHNGELVNGARRTSRRGRPWTIVCCVSGFTEDRTALKFEWCWQNPTVSARLKHTVGVLKGLRRLPYAVGTLHLLVRAPLFNQLDLTLHIFEPELLQAAKARVEVFLAVRGGPRVAQQQVTAPQQGGAGPKSDDECALPSIHTQVPNVSSSDGSAAAPVSLQLPPLESSPLFHVEVLTRQAFEDAYLSHDRCLLLPSIGFNGAVSGGVDNNNYTREEEGEDSCLSASCPYDVCALSQAARAEWSNASWEDTEAREEGRSELSVSTGWNERVTATSCAQSPTPSPGHTEDGTPNMILSYRSGERAVEKEEEGKESGELRQVYSLSATRSTSRPHDLPLTPSRALVTGGGIGDCAKRTLSSHPRAPSLPTAFDATATINTGPAAPAPAKGGDGCEGGSCSNAIPYPRIPLRFAQYGESDFANEHAEQHYRLHHGLFPCSLCTLPLRPPYVVHCSRAPFCELHCHLSCLAMWMLYTEETSSCGGGEAVKTRCAEECDVALPTLQRKQQQQQSAANAAAPPATFRRLIPSQPCPCPLCGVLLQWGVLIKEMKKRAVVEARLQAAQRRAKIEQRWQARLAQINGHCAGRDGKGYTRKKRHRTGDGGASSSSGVGFLTSCASDTSGAAASASPLPRTCNAFQDVSSTPSISIPPQPTSSSSQKMGEVSLVSPTAVSGQVDASLLSWTAFCEDDWLM